MKKFTRRHAAKSSKTSIYILPRTICTQPNYKSHIVVQILSVSSDEWGVMETNQYKSAIDEFLGIYMYVFDPAKSVGNLIAKFHFSLWLG